MAKVIALANQKGGTGKTTSAMNLAACLSAMGRSVLLIDLDPQANATSGLGFSSQTGGKTVYDALARGEHPSRLVQKKGLQFHLIPASPDLAGATVELVSVPNREFRLHHILHDLRHAYDYILIDSAPSLGVLTINALVAADYVLIPAQAEYYSLEGLAQLLQTVEMMRKNFVRSPKVLGVFLTMYDEGNRLNRAVREEVEKNFPGKVFETRISRAVELAEAPSFGKTILEYEPESRSAREYYDLAREIEGSFL